MVCDLSDLRPTAHQRLASQALQQPLGSVLPEPGISKNSDVVIGTTQRLKTTCIIVVIVIIIFIIIITAGGR